MLFSDFTSSNTVASVFNNFRKAAEERWGKRGIVENSTMVLIEVDSLDHIIYGRSSRCES
jgi:hypothetical protein